jgi:hypothetical protein
MNHRDVVQGFQKPTLSGMKKNHIGIRITDDADASFFMQSPLFRHCFAMLRLRVGEPPAIKQSRRKADKGSGIILK